MHELTSIVKAYRKAVADGVRVVLATVVRTRGSVYRRAGARMLIAIDGRGVSTPTGAISGGCLERDVCERACIVAATGEAAVVTYDTTAAEEIVWGLGLGCNGMVEVLLESLNDEHGEDLMRFLGACLERRTRGAMAIVFHKDVEAGSGAVAARIITRLMLDESGSLAGRVVCQAVAEDLRAAVMSRTAPIAPSGVAHTKSYDTPLGAVEAFIESIEPPTPLVIFGAGADAVPVARLAHQVGLHVTIIDHRPAYATPERFPCADEIIVCRPEVVARRVTIDAGTIAVVMTHSYEHDRELLKMLVASSARYIGMLGPKRRTERMLIELSEAGSFEFAAADRARLHAPVGLDIGAETPEEIAVSIIAEVRACLAGRTGGMLTDRDAPIHAAADGDTAAARRAQPCCAAADSRQAHIPEAGESG